MTLRHLSPDDARAERVRMLCHARLARQRKRRAPREALAVTLERAAIGGFCTIYLLSVAIDALNVLMS